MQNIKEDFKFSFTQVEYLAFGGQYHHQAFDVVLVIILLVFSFLFVY